MLADLAPFVERACDRRPGRRIPELLALGNPELVRALAPNQEQRFADLLGSPSGAVLEPARSSVRSAGCWAICRHDTGFPSALSEIRDRPWALFGVGDQAFLEAADPQRTVTVVGARRASQYGLSVARRLGAELTSAGLLVVSGMALGIDGAVHRGCLDRGSTLAVLGSGPDRPYPASHRSLHDRIASTGAVVSELPPGSRPWRWCFPARNRIMAALAGITVVVEAAERSGSLITAEMAWAQGRDVGAVPGPVSSPVSAGTNDLLASGAALIRDGNDVVEALGPVHPGPVPTPIGPELGEGALSVLDAIMIGTVAPDAIVLRTGLDVERTMAAISTLEIRGYVSVSPDGSISATGLRPPGPG